MQPENNAGKVRIINVDDTNVAALEHRGDPRLIGASVSRFIAWRRQNDLPPQRIATFNILHSNLGEGAPENYRGRELGLAFQLVDNALDYSANPGELGKQVGDDLAEGKPTLPYPPVESSQNRGNERLVPERGVEPPTPALRMRCSAN